MKTIQSKSLLTLIIIFFIIGFSTSAKNSIGFNSTFYQNKNNGDSIIHSMMLVQNSERVVYPEVLREHREESKEYIKHYSKTERAYIIHLVNKGQKYFPQARAIFTKYGLPHEFQVLPALESAFNGNAVSPAGAVGYWQFMSVLAKEYGLITAKGKDERRNFTKSTIAAAKFFKDQLEYFNDDMLLTVAAYNCGQGRVRQALKKSKVENPDYWDVRQHLPAETRRFVMNFLALNVIVNNYDKFIAKNMDFEAPRFIQIAQVDTLISPEDFALRNSNQID